MTKDEAMDLLSKGRYLDWNNYRKANPDWKPDLAGTDLSNIKLVFSKSGQFDLTDANLCGANLSNINNLKQEYTEYDSSFNEDGTLDSWQAEAYLNLKGAQIDIFTKFPANFHPTVRGAVLVSVAKTQNTEAENALSVFISYAWANEDMVLAIDQWLRLKGLKTKIDKRDFFAGSRIRDEILRVMQECDAVVIFYSDESKDKPWTQFERELASDLEMEAKKEGRRPPRIIYFVIDTTQLPNIVERNRIAIMAKGKKFEVACEELYYGILQIAKGANYIDLNKWSDFVF
ncbi:MAG TPA: toll/interleukin-1 receptor domain-containing protein [Blastocatellia bacterium]|nr:toll/interleukin-1 receptor domain-containing protein [Blastocatellia bacterium]